MYKVGEAGEKAERELIERSGMGNSKFHMGHEEEITIVGQNLKRNTGTILGNEIHRNGKKILGKL